MGLLSWIVFGLTIGVFGNYIVPGKNQKSPVILALLGTISGFIGGAFFHFLGYIPADQFSLGGMISSQGASFLLLGLYKLKKGR